MYDTIGFIGAGRVARIMLEGLSRAGALPRRILVHDPSGAAVAALRARVPSVQAATLAETAGADLVFGALHPPPSRPPFPRSHRRFARRRCSAPWLPR